MSDFIDFLKEHRKGELVTELTEAMQELTELVMEHDKKGSITIKLEVAPLDGGWAVFVSDDLKKKLPEADREGNIMFADDQNNLFRKDPKQLTMADEAKDAIRGLVEAGVESVSFHPDPMVGDGQAVVEHGDGEAAVVDLRTGEARS